MKTQEFLADNEVETKAEVNAKKERYQLEKAKELLAGASKLIVAKGKKVVQVDLKKEKLDDAAITKMLLGPTGNLRAPTLVVGKTLLVGFEEAAYNAVFN